MALASLRCGQEVDMKTTTKKLAELTLDPRNTRRHTSRNLKAIRDSLTEFGQRRPAVIREDGLVLAGNGMVAAAIELGWKELAVTVVPSDWTDEQARAYSIADNRAADLAEWDGERLLAELEALDGDALLAAAGFDPDELDDLRAELEETATVEDGEKAHGQAAGVAELAERYANKVTRQLVNDFPNAVYVWIIGRLVELRKEYGFQSNSEVFAQLVAERFGDEVPSWSTE
jgi:ParB-like chromosome segregation protein Spo0J